MPITIKVPENAFNLIEKALKYRFWDKERERSNHAVKLRAEGPRPFCPTRHNTLAWSGPPHDLIQSITCLDCQSYATEPEMRDMGYDFNDCPDWIFFQIMDARIEQRWVKGNPTFFAMRR